MGVKIAKICPNCIQREDEFPNPSTCDRCRRHDAAVRDLTEERHDWIKHQRILKKNPGGEYKEHTVWGTHPDGGEKTVPNINGKENSLTTKRSMNIPKLNLGSSDQKNPLGDTPSGHNLPLDDQAVADTPQ